MTGKQQEQTWEYFQRFAADWRAKSQGGAPDKVNVIEQRNGYVLAVVDGLPRAGLCLDVGCGTGELVCALGRRGKRAVGVDFAEDMIRLCRDKAQKEAVPNVEFVHGSIFDYRPAGAAFDVVSANGLIEYISPAQLDQLLDRLHGIQPAGGALVIGSRNRLFNAVSFNEYTRMEMACGAYGMLVEEIMLIQSRADKPQCLAALAALDSEKLPAVEEHPATGIEVGTRHQYTPSQLIRRLGRHGYRAVDICPIHYHLAVPRFRRQHPQVHKAVADLVQHLAGDCFYLLPASSSFMIHARRA